MLRLKIQSWPDHQPNFQRLNKRGNLHDLDHHLDLAVSFLAAWTQHFEKKLSNVRGASRQKVIFHLINSPRSSLFSIVDGRRQHR